MQKEEFVREIKLPPASKFASLKKDISPYERFFMWIAKQVGGRPEGKLINVSGVVVSKKFGTELDNQVKLWMKKMHKMNKGQIVRNFPWIFLDHSPACFTKEKELLKTHAYIKKDLFIDPLPKT